MHCSVCCYMEVRRMCAACWVCGDTYLVAAEEDQERHISVLLEEMEEHLVPAIKHIL
jgi:hypothetical protein